MPATNVDYWKTKISRNVERHSRQLEKLTADGWVSLTLWECELTNAKKLKKRLILFLE